MRHAYWLGLTDAIEQGGELHMGLSWQDDEAMNDAYERGANMGELIMRPVNWIRAALSRLVIVLP